MHTVETKREEIISQEEDRTETRVVGKVFNIAFLVKFPVEASVLILYEW